MAVRVRDQRGLAESTQWAMLFPVILLVSLGIIQAGIYLHGRNVAQRAATSAVDTARGSYGTRADAERVGRGIAQQGGLREVSVKVNRGAVTVTADVRANPVFIFDLGLTQLHETASAPLEKVSTP